MKNLEEYYRKAFEKDAIAAVNARVGGTIQFQFAPDTVSAEMLQALKLGVAIQRHWK